MKDPESRRGSHPIGNLPRTHQLKVKEKEMSEIKHMSVEVVGLNFEDEAGTIVKCLVKDAPPIGHEFGVLTLGDPSSSATDQELVEKYAGQIRNRPLLGPDKHEPIESILTRFLLESRRDVDVDALWLNLCERCKCHVDGISSIVSKQDLAAALESVKGDTNG